MEKTEIIKYVEKLKEFEKSLSDGVMNDDSFISEIDTLLKRLDNEFNKTAQVKAFDFNVKIKKLNPDAVIPTYAKLGDAGVDLTITSIIYEQEDQIMYGHGLAIEIPMGYVGLILPRSSVTKFDLSLANCVGVIDSGYRGELCSVFNKKYGKNSRIFKIGERSSQLIILPFPKINYVETDILSDTERSTGGFGHTGR